MHEYETVHACHKLLKELFRLQPGESVAITCDTESSMELVEATAQAAYLLGGKPLIIKQPAPRGVGKVGDPDMAIPALVGAIKNCDVWIEYNAQWLLYSTASDLISADPENRPRYICLAGADPGVLIRNVGKVDFSLLMPFMEKIWEATCGGKHFKITTPAGTDLEFDNYPGRRISLADGRIYEKGANKMLPGQIAWTPDHETLNGVIVVDGSFTPPQGKLQNPVFMKVEKGYVTKIYGEGSDARAMSNWFASFNHPDMYVCAHISYGFGPYAILSGSVTEDERVWGSTEWGFGNTPVLAGLPNGIPAPSHTDGICLNTSLWMDGVQVLDEGRIVGPTAEIVELARKLGK